MLHACEAFSVSCGLRFNSAKTQLIRFGRCHSSVCTDCFLSCGAPLPFLDSVIHLGHTLRHDLGDEDDIALRTRNTIWKANCISVPMTRLLFVSRYMVRHFETCLVKLSALLR